MPDDVAEPTPQTAVEKSTAKSRQPRPNRAARTARHDAMVAFCVAEKRRDSMMQYGALSRRICAQFNTSSNTAERVIASALDVLRKDFERFCQDAPRAIFDGYMQLHAEHMSRAALASRDRDRAMHLNGARQNLDSVRDMFGLKSAVDVNINLGGGIAPDAYAPLTDEQVDALAMLDANNAQRIIDVPSIEQSVALAGVAIDAIESSSVEDEGDD